MSALGRRAVQGLTGAVHSAATKPGTERLRFFYLDKRVKGECIRLALVVAGIPFEDVRVSYAEVAAMRDAGRLPFSQVPVLQIGDDPTLHGQSQALLRWAGRKGGMYPEEHQLRIDAVTDVIVELYEHVSPYCSPALRLRSRHLDSLSRSSRSATDQP